MEIYIDVLGCPSRWLDGVEKEMKKFILYVLDTLFQAIVMGTALAFVLAELIRRGYLDM